MKFIEFICKVVQEYALAYNMDEKEVFFLFSKKEVFEYISDHYLELKDAKDILNKLHCYINK